MKNTHRSILTVVALATFTVSTATVQSEDYLYETTNGTVTITGYTGPGGDVIIPSQINGLPVTSIGEYAFDECIRLTRIIIPDSVTSIGMCAFSECTSLTSVTIPNSVTSIGRAAFAICSSLTNAIIGNSVTSIGAGALAYCTSLTSVTIPNSVTSIDYRAFGGCTSLTAIEVDPANPSYSSVDGVLFNKTQTLVRQCPGGKTGTYIIPNSVTRIGPGAFADCTDLTSIVIPNSVTNIMEGAFDRCTDLTSISIPNSVTNIGYEAFYQCTSLTNVTIGNSVTYLGGLAFAGCTSLTSVTIPNSVTSIGEYAFGNCPSLTRVYFEGNAPSAVGGGVFSSSPVTVYYLAGTTGWGPAFGGRTATLWSPTLACGYTINNGTIRITKYLGCASQLSIPGTIDGLPVSTLGDSAFSGNACLTSIVIPDSVTSIGDYAFEGCTSLKAITVDALNPNYSSLDGVLFDKRFTSLISCPGGKIGSYKVPNSVTVVVAGAFSGCTSLTGCFFEGNAPSADSKAFDGVWATAYYLSGTTGWGATLGGLPTSLWSPQVPCAYTVNGDTISITRYLGPGGEMSIPNAIDGLPVSSIGNRAFYQCTNLTTITIPDGVTRIEDEVFSGCTSLTSVTIPNSVTSIGEWAFAGCTSLTNITIPASVTTIGGWTFRSCTNLTGVYFKGNTPSVGEDLFFGSSGATVYYLPGTVGWGDTYAGRPTAQWLLPYPLILTTNPSFGVQTNGFGFRISWATNASVVVEAVTALPTPVWSPVSTNVLVNSWSDFRDPEWTNYPSRFYRIRSP